MTQILLVDSRGGIIDSMFMATLWIVATPIGNLEDISLRALRVLREVDGIICEDTRVTAKLLARHEIQKPLYSCPQHASDAKIASLLQRVSDGASLAYVSDAGTPGVNDPGGKLVAEAVKRNLTIIPIPGASALTAALSVCGFAVDRFVYEGFLPHKKGRQALLVKLCERAEPTVLFESTHRIFKLLIELAALLEPSRQLYVGRELTKLHETHYRGTITDIKTALQVTSSKGEFVIIIKGT